MSPVAKILSDNVIAHETAHQWWGDLLSWKSYRDQWLFEALAELQRAAAARVRISAAVSPGHGEIPQDLLAKNKEGSLLAEAGPVTFGTRLNCSHFPRGYEAISYGRGTWLFHMLRSMLRDARGGVRPEERRARRAPLGRPGGCDGFCAPSAGRGSAFRKERSIPASFFR